MVTALPWGPREVADLSERGLRPLMFPVQIPLNIRTSTGRILGKGKVRPDVLPSGVPQGWGEAPVPLGHTFQCQLIHRGVFLDQAVQGNFFNNRLIWHASCLPRRDLSAGRKLREANLPPLEVRKEVRDRIFRHAWTALCQRDRDLAGLWRYLMPPDIVDLPFLFPVRTTNGLEWVTADECKSRYPRLLLVPMAIALQDAWNLPIPAIGFVTGKASFYASSFGQSFQSELGRCMLVEVTDKCTGLLYPFSAAHPDLHLLKAEASYTHIGLYTWIDPTIIRTTEGGIPVDRRLFKNDQLPPYDHVVDPWAGQGISISNGGRIFNDIYFGKEINDRLKTAEPIAYPEDLLDFVINEGDDWE